MMAKKNKQLTEEQKAKLITACLPYVKTAVKATVERWDAERAIECEVGKDVSDFDTLLGDLAFACDVPEDAETKVTAEDVKLILEFAGVI
jgi:hypothetical protein